MFRLLREKLTLTFKSAVFINTAFGIALRGFGDLIQQTFEIKYGINLSNELSNKNPASSDYNWIRTRNISSSGLLIGPLNYYWYRYLDKISPSKSSKSIVKKVFYDQLFGATFFTFLFIMCVSLADGFSIKESFAEFLDKFPFIYLVDWLIWPPSQALNFYLVPREYRVAFVNIILLIWNIFLSFAKYNYHND